MQGHLHPYTNQADSFGSLAHNRGQMRQTSQHFFTCTPNAEPKEPNKQNNSKSNSTAKPKEPPNI